jgi:hypothetical protein
LRRLQTEAPYRRAFRRVKASRIKALAGSAQESVRMRVVAITNCPVRLSFLTALLRDAGVEPVLLDSHVAAMEGSIGAIPRRIVVAEEDERQALRVIREAGV